jgi:transglutaminase-like putative cysteine protease
MADGYSMLHLTPRNTARQRVESFSLSIEPQPDEFQDDVDPFGNHVTRVAVHHPHRSLVVDSTIIVDLDGPVLAPSDGASWEEVAAMAADLRGDGALDVAPFLAHTQSTARLAGLTPITSAEFTSGRSLVDAVSGLCAHIFRSFVFDPGFTDVATPLETVLAERRGVCQDFAHVSVAALRSMGIPARYVSGYIETMPPPGEPKLIGVDASHAWCSVWAGELGWLHFDPTNNQMPPLRHITIGWGRDYDDIAPVRGVVIGPGGHQSLHVAVDVVCLD